jgi:hypothetical protein
VSRRAYTLLVRPGIAQILLNMIVLPGAGIALEPRMIVYSWILAVVFVNKSAFTVFPSRDRFRVKSKVCCGDAVRMPLNASKFANVYFFESGLFKGLRPIQIKKFHPLPGPLLNHQIGLIPASIGTPPGAGHTVRLIETHNTDSRFLQQICGAASRN